MANARERAKSKRESQREFHLGRIEHIRKTRGAIAALDAAYAYFKAERLKCTNDDEADRISAELFQTMITKAAEFPRRSAR